LGLGTETVPMKALETTRKQRKQRKRKKMKYMRKPRTKMILET